MSLQHAARAVLGVLAAFFAWFAVKPLWFAFCVIRFFPYSIDREEGFLLEQALRFRAGLTIYPNLADYPYTVGNYPPVFPALFAVLTTAMPGLEAGRLIVLLAAVGIAALACLYVYLETREPIAAVLAPTVFLCSWNVEEWLPLARVDFPALFFGFAGFVVARRGPARRWLPASIILFALAFYTRQTQLLAPAAVMVGLVVARQRREAAWLAGGLAALAGVVGIGLVVVTRGQFWLHNVTYNKNPMDWWQFTMWMRNVVWFFGRYLLLALAAALVGGAILRCRDASAGLPSVALISYLALAAMSLVTIAKRGSAANYQLEFDLLVAVTLAVALGHLIAALKQSPAPRFVVAVLAASLLLLGAHAFRTWQLAPVIFPPPLTAEARIANDEVALMVLEEPGEVLTELPIYAIRGRKPVLYQPFIMASLASEGKWDPAPFLEDLRSGRFALLIATQDFAADKTVTGFTPEMMHAILGRYELTRRFQTYRQNVYLYRPKPQEAAPR